MYAAGSPPACAGTPSHSDCSSTSGVQISYPERRGPIRYLCAAWCPRYVRCTPQSLLLLALRLCEDEGPEADISGILSSGLPSVALPPSASSSNSTSAPSAPPFALMLMLRFDLPGLPRLVRPGALTKSAKLDSDEVGVCPPFAVPVLWLPETGVRTGRR